MNLIYVDVPAGATIDGAHVSGLDLPLECLIVSLERDGHRAVVHGDTTIHAGDRVAVVVNRDSAVAVREMFTADQSSASSTPT